MPYRIPDWTACVYKITNNVNGKVYIGQTENYYDRMSYHRKQSYKFEPKTDMYKDMKLHGFDSFKFEILYRVYDELDDCSRRTISALEERYIKTYKGLGISYNKRDRGECQSQEAKNKRNTKLQRGGSLLFIESTNTNREGIWKFEGVHNTVRHTLSSSIKVYGFIGAFNRCVEYKKNFCKELNIPFVLFNGDSPSKELYYNYTSSLKAQ